MATSDRTFTQDNVHDLFKLASNGGLSRCSKEDLERYAAMLCSVEARPHRRDPEFESVGETVRALLVLRMSEEASRQTTLMSIIAIAISVVALLWSVVMFVAR